MIKTICIVCLLMLQCSVNGQIQELRKAQDQRKAYINPSRRVQSTMGVTQFVNPFVGTGGHGHTYPGASAPFGMIQLSPDTRHDGWDGCSGYHYSDSIIYGFSHTHLSGTGVPDYGDLLIVPQSGEAKIDPGYSSEDGYGATFSHSMEAAKPGTYAVQLISEDIYVRLAVTERCGIHEYTFNQSEEKHFILLDLDHRDKVLASEMNVIGDNVIQGHRISEAWASEQHFYFHLETNVPFEESKHITDNGRHKLLLTFPKTTGKVLVKVGISAVDETGAQQNLNEEIPAWIFNIVSRGTNTLWENELKKINFLSKDREVMKTFYTALYHSYLAPNLFNDVDGRYRGRDLKVHTLDPETSTNYTVFSLWDTYRAAHPLFTLTQPKRTDEFIQTFLRQYEEGGDLPVWELAGNETECMIGYHSVSVIADATVKGYKGFDLNLAKEGLIATSNFDEYGKTPFVKNGFISTGDEPESVSKTLEYAYDDYCISQFLIKTKLEGFEELTQEYLNRSFNFVNLYDPATKFMRGRRSGQWFGPFDPSEVNFNYTEANSWQYSMYAPHAVGVLTDLLGGKDSLETWLDRLFTTESNLAGRHQVDITGLIGQYAHGNEPSHHMAYLYNYTNAPHKTQFYVDRILKEMYSNTPEGLSGNEDCGQMSAWYILSAMGIYPIAPGSPYYEIGRPLGVRSSIQLPEGKSFHIMLITNNYENKYIQEIKLNGEVYENLYIHHDTIMAGGTMEIVMGPDPVDKLEYRNHAPTLMELPAKVVPVPFFEQADRVFDDSLAISLGIIFPENYSIHYTLDGSIPTRTSAEYKVPFTLTENATVKAIAFNSGSESSVISNEFVQRDKGIRLDLHSEYANQYAAAGKYTLIDGIRGGNEYRTGDWQGYWAQDIIAEVSFDAPRSINEIGIGCLSDMKSWVFLPEQIIIEGSIDGKKYKQLGIIQIDHEPKDKLPAHHENFVLNTKNSKAFHKLRITVKNPGKCPEWHLGAGNDTWIFVDEILLKYD
ncbi:MAG: putative alpha-1,2-mannosidase [Flavobacteriaceae bacterium]|jgi:predicted alpha-1,2-mannosidase